MNSMFCKKAQPESKMLCTEPFDSDRNSEIATLDFDGKMVSKKHIASEIQHFLS
jgi:hypothetical protein